MLLKHSKSFVNLYLIVFLSFFICGCAVGITRVEVLHEPLNQINDKNEGNILIKQFVDKRPDTRYIGNKRNALGIVMGHIATKEEIKLEKLLTQYFAEALKEAGYNAIIQEEQFDNISKIDAIIEGEIIEFWIDMRATVWHKMEVKVIALDPYNYNVLWEKYIRGEYTNVLWLGITSEYENVIRQALTKALNQAARGFASYEFYKAIKKY
jgi:hypothetical protein